ncbi:adhesion G-protein coupled receptor D1-like [Dreissena polymorpha]|uniref:adhesion G-protein coupled receptor D1-like n=1 Tax=Dreissena polymorpha TaxID=45954 RepID=UPI002264C67A|nr:adhesion G-protein coupled receptor D1-like [Dreissena polymorpha]
MKMRFFLLISMSLVSYAVLSSPAFRILDEKCIWTVGGGNFTYANRTCRTDGGAIFTFSDIVYAIETLRVLNISQATTVFIGAIVIHVNQSSRYFDWLSRPGTWRESLNERVVDVNDTINDDKRCITLKHGSLYLEDCSTPMNVTVCENGYNKGCDSEVQPILSERHDPPSDSGPNDAPIGTSYHSTYIVSTEAFVNYALDQIGNINTDNLTIDNETHAANAREMNNIDVAQTDMSVKDLNLNENVLSINASTSHVATTSSESTESDVNGTLADTMSEEDHSIPTFSTASTCSNDKLTSSLTSSSTTPPVQTLSSECRDGDASKICNRTSQIGLLSNEILQNVPDGENGTKTIEFSELLNEIFEKAEKGNISLQRQMSSTVATNKPPPLPFPGLFVGHPISALINGSPGGQNSSVPITEVSFHVSEENAEAENGRLRTNVSRLHLPLLTENHVISSPELSNLTRLLKALKDKPRVNQTTIEEFGVTVSNTVASSSALAESSQLKGDAFVDIMVVAEHLADKLDTPRDRIDISTNSINFSSHVVRSCDQTAGQVVTVVDKPGSDMKATLTGNIFNYLNTSGIRISTVTYHGVKSFVNATNAHVSSHVMAVTVYSINGNRTKKRSLDTASAITFEMKTFVSKHKEEASRECVFWDFAKSAWSSAECTVVDQNASHTTCTCNHLTNFAVLVMYVETKDMSLGNRHALFTLTTVGCSLSIACLLMTLIAYVYLNMLGNEKILIHFNLSLALMMGQLVFVSSSDAHRNQAACKAVAVLLHFLFMASFSWMLVEGIALYLCCTKGIFNHRDMRVKYILLGWGLPLLIVIISVAARTPEYGNGPQYSCWLSVKEGLIWAFMGPMLVVVLMNMFVLGLVVKVFLTLKTISEKTELARLRGSLRAMLTLLPLLGLTWILGLLVPINVVFHYFFVIANTVQGMCIFFLHCICNDEIRRKFREKRRRWSTTRTLSEVDMAFPGRRKLGSIDTAKFSAVGNVMPNTAECIVSKPPQVVWS